MNADKKILSRYELIIYEDGTTETRRLPLEVIPEEKTESFIDLSHTTSRIGQMLLTLKYLVQQFDNYEFDNLDMFSVSSEFKIAMSKAGDDFGVEVKSVLDKFIRQTRKINGESMTMDYLRDVLHTYLEELDSNPKQILIKDILINSVSAKTSKQDKLAINLFFDQPATPFILKNGKTV
ncbi:MAG: hypothetical protein LUK37_03625 [Clostridia bacterium]|nr:hypothetical protein [Clostridia bacterium]